MKTLPISDYSTYDYKMAFWDGQNRHYEDACEKHTLFKLLKKIKIPLERVADIGSGFGRLYEIYSPFTKKSVLIDYAMPLLKEARSRISPSQSVCVKANIYYLPIQNEAMDLALSVRVLHHVSALDAFFLEIHRILKPNGYFILEIPNKRHALNILKFFTGKLSFNPFSRKPYPYGDTFINYHPSAITSLLKKKGFQIVLTLSLIHI